MDFYDKAKKGVRTLRLAALYVSRIVFAPDHFQTSLGTKVKANLNGGFTADQWALYSLDQHKRKAYLSEFDWYRSRCINEPFSYMLNNKVAATEVLKHYVRVPEIYFTNSEGIIHSAAGETVGPEAVAELLRRCGRMIIKPYDRGKGLGVHVFSYHDDAYWIDRDSVETSALIDYLKSRKNWYCSETVEQHEYAAHLYPNTINTIRIITLRDPGSGRFKIFFAVQRVGRKETIPVDNASAGGFVCKIDMESGRLSEARTLHDAQVYTTHPDSGVRFEDVVIPEWEQLKEEVLALSNRFPYLNFVAWDIVKLPDGQNCVIEANSSSGVNIIQLWGGQRNGELGDFYRHYGIIK